MSNDELKNAASKAEDEKLWIDAAFLYDKLYELDKSNEALSKSGWCYSRAGKFQIATEKFMELSVKEPTSAKCLYMIGYQYYSQKNWNEAAKWYEKAIEMYPDYFVVKYRLGYTYLQIAGIYKKLTKPEFWRALGQFQECHKLWLNFSEEEKNKNRDIYADVCFQHGKAILQLDKKIDEAIDLLRRSLKFTNNIDCQYELAKALNLKGENQEALEVLPKSNKYYVVELRCTINYELGEYNVALADLTGLMKTRKMDYLFILLAKIYQKLGKLNDAYNTCKECLLLSNSNHKVYYEMAQICYELSLFSEAKIYADKAVSVRLDKYSLDYPDASELLESIQQKLVNHKGDDRSVLREKSDQKVYHGTIKSYKPDRGYGFIKSDIADVFFHISKCNFVDIVVGCKVYFEIENGEKGISAIKIKKSA